MGCTKLLCVSVVFLMFGLVKMSSSPSNSRFDDFFQPSWAFDHFLYQGEVLMMKLDTNSGAGFSSRSKYMFGKVTAEMKFVEGDSAGTVTAFYMSSDGAKHNEFDFEFLGNSSGEPYLLQTNVYVNGVGNREQRFSLWFDPTIDFHSYSILWTPHRVQFMVDDTLIRVHTNMEHKGLAFPKDQAMGVYSSIWNADDWATQGGRVKTDWSHAPFIASYKGFHIDACECVPTVAESENIRRCSGGGDSGGDDERRRWWNQPTVPGLSIHQRHQLIWVHAKHKVYDYCTDVARFPVPPVECIHHYHHYYHCG